RLLLNYAQEPVIAKTEDEFGVEIEVTVPLAELMLHELESDSIVFTNAIYQQILTEYTTHINNGNVPDLNYFVNYPDQLISQLAVDLVQIPYQLSDWERHFIYVQTESQLLRQAAVHSVNVLKLRRLEQMIAENQKQLRDTPDSDQQMQLMQQQLQLLQAKRHFSSLLGRIVLK
ncbi:MAG: hypothetical protein ACRC3B_20875, partial [Bacteroidia bacterium]